MASLQSIFKSPYYFGEISLEDTKNILLQEPPLSYLFRRLKNGSITLATLRHSSKHLFEIEVRNCNCVGNFKSIQSFESLEEFIKCCNSVLLFFNWGKLFDNFMLPVTRKNPLPLEEIAKGQIITYFADSIDQLNLPRVIRENLISHNINNHFEASIDENKAIETLSTNKFFYYTMNLDKEYLILSIMNMRTHDYKTGKPIKNRKA